MKHYLLIFVVLCTIGTTNGMCAVQPQNSKATAAILSKIQSATNNFDDALLRGDSDSALKFLASDFELGNHQYRKRDLEWIRQVLPGQLKIARFTELSVVLSSAEITGEQAIVRGKIEAAAGPKIDLRGTNTNGGYGAIWIKTSDGWRLKKADQVFNLLLKASGSTAPPAKISSFDIQTDKTALPRENPFLVLEQSHRSRIDPLTFSPDNSVLASNDFYDGLRFSSAHTGDFIKAMHTPMSINSMTYAPNGTLITGHNDGKVRLWDVESGKLLREFSVSKWSVYSVCVSPDGRTLAADGAGSVQLWDIADGRESKTFGDTGGNVTTIAFSTDGTILAFGARQGIELWNIKEEKLIQRIKYEQWGDFSPDGKTIVTASFGKLIFRNIRSGKVEHQVAIPNPLRKPESLKNRNGPISELIYEPGAMIAPNGKIAASIYQDGSIGVWATQTGTLLRMLRGFQSNVMGGDISTLTFSPDSTAIAAGSRSGEIAIWHVMPSKS